MKPIPAAFAALTLALGLASCATAPADGRLYTAQGELCGADAKPGYFNGRNNLCNTKATWNMLNATKMDASWTRNAYGGDPNTSMSFSSETVSP